MFCYFLAHLQNVGMGNFSIYIHSEPGFVFDESTTRSSLFLDRQLKNSIKVTSSHCPFFEYEDSYVEIC